jgi:hypothetical protein
MVIDNGNFGGTGRGPAEHDSPLVIDADGMKTGEITMEGFQAIARGNGEVRKVFRSIHLHELAQAYARNGSEAPIFFLQEKLPRVSVREGLDHNRSAARVFARYWDLGLPR